MQIHYFFLENIAKSGLGWESSQGRKNQKKIQAVEIVMVSIKIY